MIIPVFSKSIHSKIQTKIFSSTKEIPHQDWNFVIQNKNIYLSLPYLSAMEMSLGAELGFRYLLFYERNSTPLGAAIIQCLNFIDKGLSDKQEVCRIRNTIKRRLLTTKGIRLMTCGTPFASGENGFIHTNNITSEAAYTHLATALLEIQEKEKKIAATPVILFKELLPNTFPSGNSLLEKGFSEFEIDVNMIMKIPPNWKNLNDYLNAMVTKFRTKAKSALRKSEDILVQNLSLAEIEFHKQKILGLYLQVLNKSQFQFGALNAESFVNLKRNLDEDFILKGYYLNDSLIGFSSSFIFNSILDANYVGINYEYNQEYAVYQRMLYDYVELAIERNCSELRFGRTAEEIKSSIGAKPMPMKLFIKHRNFIANRILKAIVATIKPSQYELRKPFKKN